MNTKQFLALIIPLVVLVIAPGALLFDYQTGSFAIQSPPTFIFIGGLLFLAGAAIFIETVNALHRIGEGTIAPWEPTVNLVTSGSYAYTRNPMIGAAILILLGEAVAFESVAILVYAFIVFIANSLYFKYIEEPGLEKRFGQKYKEYKNNVPMWLPSAKSRADKNQGNG
jgi:protein-S-isoprenylcysteine O-methyltransferase Ste14